MCYRLWRYIVFWCSASIEWHRLKMNWQSWTVLILFLSSIAISFLHIKYPDNQVLLAFLIFIIVIFFSALFYWIWLNRKILLPNQSALHPVEHRLRDYGTGWPHQGNPPTRMLQIPPVPFMLRPRLGYTVVPRRPVTPYSPPVLDPRDVGSTIHRRSRITDLVLPRSKPGTDITPRPASSKPKTGRTLIPSSPPAGAYSSYSLPSSPAHRNRPIPCRIPFSYDNFRNYPWASSLSRSEEGETSVPGSGESKTATARDPYSLINFEASTSKVSEADEVVDELAPVPPKQTLPNYTKKRSRKRSENKEADSSEIEKAKGILCEVPEKVQLISDKTPEETESPPETSPKKQKSILGKTPEKVAFSDSDESSPEKGEDVGMSTSPSNSSTGSASEGSPDAAAGPQLDRSPSPPDMPILRDLLRCEKKRVTFQEVKIHENISSRKRLGSPEISSFGYRGRLAPAFKKPWPPKNLDTSISDPSLTSTSVVSRGKQVKPCVQRRHSEPMPRNIEGETSVGCKESPSGSGTSGPPLRPTSQNSPKKDEQVESSPKKDEQVESSPKKDEQVEGSPKKDEQVEGSPKKQLQSSPNKRKKDPSSEVSVRLTSMRRHIFYTGPQPKMPKMQTEEPEDSDSKDSESEDS